MKLTLIVAFLVSASIADECSDSAWGAWSEWNVVNHDNTIKSFPVYEDSGRGAIMRDKLMKMKIARMTDDFFDRPSEGRVNCMDGFANDLPCLNVDQLSFVSIADFLFDPAIDDKPPGSDLWGWLDPETGEEYAIMGIRSGTSFIKITDPENPVVVGHLPTHGTAPNIWRDIKVIDNYAFIVAELDDHGMQVFDLTRLRGAVAEMFTEDAHYAGFGNCHNIVSNEETNFLYGVGCTYGNYPNLCGGGLHVIDATDPLSPQYAGCFGEDGYTHDAQCVIYRGPDVRYQGREICFNYNEDTLTIVDVTDKTNMVMLSREGYSSAMYTHQGWLTEDHTIVLLDDELDETEDDMTTKTYIWDVQDLHAPLLMNTYRHPTDTIDHNQYVLGDLVFQSNYESGLRILSIDQENYALTTEAYLEFKMQDTPWGGSWSVYPYFPSGNIPVTSSPYGLFTVRPNYAAIRQQIESRKTLYYRRRYKEVLENRDGRMCPKSEEIEYK